MRGLGTDEPFIEEVMGGIESGSVSCSWRRPLRVDEIPQMATTPEVFLRPGRS